MHNIEAIRPINESHPSFCLPTMFYYSNNFMMCTSKQKYIQDRGGCTILSIWTKLGKSHAVRICGKAIQVGPREGKRGFIILTHLTPLTSGKQETNYIFF